MPYKASKIYYDGSHYIAVPKENFPSRKCGKAARKSDTQTDSVKAKFEAAYAESQALLKRERKQYIAEKLQDDFATAEEAKEYAQTDGTQEEQRLQALYEALAQSLSARQMGLLRDLYLRQRQAHGRVISAKPTQHSETSREPQGLEVYRCVGAFRKRKATLPRNILYPRTRHDR